MPRCAGKGWDICDSCLNAEFDPFECETCDDGSNYEDEDNGEELTMRQFIEIFKEAA